VRLTSISSSPPPRETPPASEWRLRATPPPEDLYRPDIGDASEHDCFHKYYIKSGETLFTTKMEKTGVNIGARVHGQWRHMEGVQKYDCTEVQPYRCTEVQENVALERMVAVGLSKRDPQEYN
jgi:hypothetical protein